MTTTPVTAKQSKTFFNTQDPTFSVLARFDSKRADDEALARGEKAAQSIASGAGMQMLLELGRAALILEQRAVIQTGANDLKGAPYRKALAAHAAAYPTLSALQKSSPKIFTALKAIVKNWDIALPILQQLPRHRVVFENARSLWEKISKEIQYKKEADAKGVHVAALKASKQKEAEIEKQDNAPETKWFRTKDDDGVEALPFHPTRDNADHIGREVVKILYDRAPSANQLKQEFSELMSAMREEYKVQLEKMQKFDAQEKARAAKAALRKKPGHKAPARASEARV
jgi:hypothetical protein